MQIKYTHILPFLTPAGNKWSRVSGIAGLVIGCTLLLCSIQMYINLNQLVRPKEQKKNGYDFISVTKTVTNQNMGKDNSFTAEDVAEMNNKHFITEAAPLQSNQFRVKASAGEMIPFSTDLFLESIDKNFLDTLPASFTWQPGQQNVPIIFSADFLELYNVFAPAQGLPQVSEETIQLINIKLDFYGPPGVQMSFTGHIVGLSNRIHTVLVPENFMQWANNKLASTVNENPSRVYLKTRDANNPELLEFLEKKNYHVNKEITRFGRIKQLLQGIIAGLTGFALMVIVLALLVFSFYIQLIIARSKDNLTLLIQLGYAPTTLGKVMSKKWLPGFAMIIGIALIITQVVQLLFYNMLTVSTTQMAFYIHPLVLLSGIILFGLCWYVNQRLVNKLLYSF